MRISVMQWADARLGAFGACALRTVPSTQWALAASAAAGKPRHYDASANGATGAPTAWGPPV